MNLLYGWPSLRAPEAAGVPLRQAVYQFFQFWRDGVGVLFGGRPFYGWHDVFPGARLVALGLFAIAFVGAAGLVTRNRALTANSVRTFPVANICQIPATAKAGGQISVQCDMASSTGSTHFFFDVFGYFE